MINLRFHIVSIVAVFLALAIGILTGTTLLDQATVKVLQNNQKSLEGRNDRLDAENAALRASMNDADGATTEFGGGPLGQVLGGELADVPVLMLAVRGIDENSVRSLQTSIRDAGGSPLGIVWFDERFDLNETDASAAIVAALQLEATPEDAKAAVVTALSDQLAVSARTTTTTSTTTTSVVAATETTTETTQPLPVATTAEEDAALRVFSGLADAGLVDWESPTEGEPGPRTLPADSLRMILVSGEGAVVKPSHLMYPLATALSDQSPPLIVAEVRNPRSSVDAATQSNTPTRGAFVDRLRSNDALSAKLITVDNLDEPFGRLSCVLALGAGANLATGKFGMAESADSVFPPKQ